MKIIAQRQWLAACAALAFVACGGDAKTKEAGAGSGGTSAASSSGGAQTEPSSEVNSAGAGALDAAGASSDAGAGGALSDAAAEAAGAGALANGGAHAAASAGAAGKAAAADGGAPNTGKPSGGTRFCERAEDCSDTLQCRGRASSTLHVCLAGCTADADCAASHRCVMPSDPLAPDKAACFLRCDDSPLVCPYAFDCYDISGQREYTCLPRQW